MKSRAYISVEVFLIFLLCSGFLLFSHEPAEIHGAVKNGSQCKQCHPGSERNFINGICCVESCVKCHDMKKHHPVKMAVSQADRRQYKLLSRGRMGCITCHDIYSKRYDSVPWRSNSLFDSLFNRQKVYKTFFLVEMNSNGQLCKKCHQEKR